MLQGFYRLQEQEDYTDQELVDFYYRQTLFVWLVYNDDSIFEDLLVFYQEKEEYLVCEGINRALNAIDNIREAHFEDAIAEHSDDTGSTYSAEEYRRVSRLIFAQVLMEAVYEPFLDSEE